ncbi:uncharacterized protein TM35_000064840 [Trypanosoma theileri]|uniref:Uncharacterized protein n=1 Tax=Trypanosoma theileri TaxID=67003 RepID=A0A1X0P4J6_9TRYP|nr:uncharacterized protein TM35_000064840 [Trypanosoma theileri]ORC91479.1 hypothetical protein TM35_000064840 [Trypanosoma theileri]
MTSHADLLAACAEFQENFASLNGKYNVVVQELHSEKETNERLRKQLESLRGNEEKLQETMRELKKDLEEANTYKERYLASNVTVEHLKGRLENARRAVADKMLEHEQELEQLREQNKDLLQRVGVCEDAGLTQRLRRQVCELEARCAELSGQLLEERERGGQQLLVAHNALREQQARLVELEQRSRALESEVTQMRSLVRRSSELQNDAAVARERAALEARQAAAQLAAAESQRRDAESQRAQMAEAHAAEVAELRAAAAKAAAEATSRSRALTTEIDGISAELREARSQLAEAERQANERVAAVRAAERVAAAALQAQLTDARTEAQAQAAQLQATLQQLQAAQREAQAQREATQREAAAGEQLRAKLDTHTQQHAWIMAQREHETAQLAAARRQVEQLQSAQREHEAAHDAAERLRLQLRFCEDELQEARRLADAADARVRDVEEAAERRLRAQRQELKDVKKQARADRSKADAVRRKLVQALLERDTVLPSSSTIVPQPLQQERGRDVAASYTHQTGGFDVLSVLRGQNEQAEALHHRIIELSR